jgi:hypothetical protein
MTFGAVAVQQNPVSLAGLPGDHFITEEEYASYHFATNAFQYYVSGRFACLTGQFPVAGLLLHHAAERALKAGLVIPLGLKKLKQKGHSLPVLWKLLCKHAAYDNRKHANVIGALNEFENLRYPDGILLEGAWITSYINTADVTLDPSMLGPSKRYVFVLQEVDEVIAAILRLSRVNPPAYTQAMPDRATMILYEQNDQTEFLRVGDIGPAE